MRQSCSLGPVLVRCSSQLWHNAVQDEGARPSCAGHTGCIHLVTRKGRGILPALRFTAGGCARRHWAVARRVDAMHRSSVYRMYLQLHAQAMCRDMFPRYINALELLNGSARFTVADVSAFYMMRCMTQCDSVVNRL